MHRHPASTAHRLLLAPHPAHPSALTFSVMTPPPCMARHRTNPLISYCSASAAAAACSSGEPWASWAALTSCAALGLASERTSLGRTLTGPVTAMLSASLLTNLGLMPPGTAAALPDLQLFLVKLSTPLLLLSADLRAVLRGARRLLPAFALAAAGTLLGALAADLLLHEQLLALGKAAHGAIAAPGESMAAAAPALGGLHVAAALTAKNIGGGINYLAVATSLDVPRALVAAGLAADNAAALVYFPLVAALASQPWCQHLDPAGALAQHGSHVKAQAAEEPLGGESSPAASSRPDPGADSTADERGSGPQGGPAAAEPLLLALAFALMIAAVSERAFGLAAALPASTALAVAVATAVPNSPIRHRVAAAGQTLGSAALYVFFATAGAATGRVSSVGGTGFVTLLTFLCVLYAVHLCVVLIIGRGVLRLSGPELLVASHANIGSAATVASLTGSRGWGALLVPGMLAATLGNSVATFVGLALASFLTR